MFSPDFALTPWLLVVVFAALVVFLGARAARKDRREYPRFKRYRSTRRRQAMFRKWLRESFLVFGGLSLGILVLVWQYVPLLLDEINGWRTIVLWRAAYASAGWVAIAATVLLVLAVVVLPVLGLFLARRSVEGSGSGAGAGAGSGSGSGSVPALGDIQAMLPRNLAEVRLGALISLNAGVVEELLFRLAVPALLYAAFGNAFFALVASALMFGALHAYQGPVGVIGTTLIGVLMFALFIATGSILAPIVAHVLINFRSFVLIPLIVLRVQDAAAGPGPGPGPSSPASSASSPASSPPRPSRQPDSPAASES